MFAGCSSLPFNSQYANAGWKKIIMAPFSGSLAETAELTFEHELAITSDINVIPASMVKVYLKEENLIDDYAKDPEKALFLLAHKLEAEGILFANIKSTTSAKRSSADLATNFAEIYVKLIDVKNKRTVASSHYESSSLFSSAHALVKDISLDSANDMKEIFGAISVNTNPHKDS